MYYTSLNIAKCFEKLTPSNDPLWLLQLTFAGRVLDSSMWVASDNHTADRTIFLRINLSERDDKYLKFHLCVWEGLIRISIWPRNRVPRHFLCSWYCPIPLGQMFVITRGVPKTIYDLFLPHIFKILFLKYFVFCNQTVVFIQWKTQIRKL